MQKYIENFKILDLLKLHVSANYKAVKKCYVFSYFAVVCLGVLIYCSFLWVSLLFVDMLLDLIQAVLVLQPGGEIASYYLYYLPYYAGILIAAVRPLAKKYLVTGFNLSATFGILILVAAHQTKVGLRLGIGLIHFAGGFFETITPIYCMIPHLLANLISV
eukprot:TRINITY_DN88747_c1_g1_i1.p1 TRINITY_DN88747_c1_g1~~TRINITY_DN88747_c1_g1_i1.p1  ORF type:complete len:161 (-),score=7.51 TRINITY_DN88747_c1_g1_i1:1338-1820(-)